jgi:hypothetical protein
VYLNSLLTCLVDGGECRLTFRPFNQRGESPVSTGWVADADACVVVMAKTKVPVSFGNRTLIVQSLH